jgi:hypothetical protein
VLARFSTRAFAVRHFIREVKWVTVRRNARQLVVIMERERGEKADDGWTHRG